ncbi:hypothetical protein CAPTEDRAFT_185752 [Capitella teleta]|uniref:Uncharacterized protein n=1 Tax=Capitella teleta TaxID=283909 RepID=R7VIA9_CAPTE|nr:hypothetical protein CAPTEDRAFT_185752 [Capitella teleta]|eukprot:ELU18272.1 hypothetical protein CAPTEDRAFT_185752 [Capitella teleta]
MQGNFSWSLFGLLVTLGVGYSMDGDDLGLQRAEDLHAVRYAKAVVVRRNIETTTAAADPDVTEIIVRETDEIKPPAKQLCRPHHKLQRLMLQRRKQSVDGVADQAKFSGLLCHVRHESTSSDDVEILSRQLRDGSTCDEHAQSLNSTDDIISLRANLDSKQCMDAGTDRLLRRVTSLLQLQDEQLQLRSNARRLMRLQCRLNRKRASCDQRREIETHDDDTLTPAEIYFLNHWPTADDIKDPSKLEMIFY